MKTGRRTLKKVLGLVLCLAMMLSIMVVGAGAAFADQSDIDTKHTEAVDMCNALNIITGFENGKFMPKDNVTREQMAKMICVLDNGGKEPQLSAGNTFTDVPTDRWSNKYIESCAARGIVVGTGGGKFSPAGKVTATQAAKMLLVELGYDDDLQKYTGSNWATQVNIDATQKGYYDELEDIDVNAPLTREHAAQMIWNALQANEVSYSYTLVTNPDGSISSKVTVSDKFEDKDGKNGLTLLEDKYGAVDTDKTTGILTGIKYNTTKEEYTYTIVNAPNDKTELENNGKYTTDKDYTALLGHNVSFVVKDDKDNTVFGAFTDDSKVVVSGLYGDIDFADFNKGDNSIEVNDTDYDTDKDIYKEVAIYSDDGHEAGYVSLTEYTRDAKEDVVPLDYFEYSAIDWDDDDDIDLIIVTPVAFGEITYVASDYVRVAESDATGWTAKALFSDKLNTEKDTQYNVYSGAAKEDYALISFDKTLKTEGTVTLLEKQTGKVTSTTNDTAVIGDATYDITYKTDLKTFRDKSVDFRTINDYVVWSKNSSSVDISDYLLITGITSGTNAKGYYEATVLFTDDTTDTVSIKSVDLGNNTVYDKDNQYTNVPNTAKAGTLWKYEINKGNYELTALEKPETGKVTSSDGQNEEFDLWLVDVDNALTDGNTASHWSAAAKAADADAKVIFADTDSASSAPTAKFASDAVVFVYDGDDYFVKSGDDLAKVTGKAAVRYAGAEENDNGYNNVTFAYITTKSVSSGDTIYGFVTSDITVTETSKEVYYSFTAWNGEEYAKLTTVDTNGDSFTGVNLGGLADIQDGKAPLQAKAIISYKLDADGNITDLTVIDAKYGALTGFDGDDIKVITNEDGYGEYTTDKDDTSFLYIDVSEKTGDKTGNYSKADEVTAADLDSTMRTIVDNSKTYYANVLIVGDKGKDLDLVVVTIDNRWDGEASDTVSFDATEAELSYVNASGSATNVTATCTPETATVAVGQNLSITVTRSDNFTGNDTTNEGKWYELILVNSEDEQDILTSGPVQGPISGTTMTFDIDTTEATPGATYVPFAFNGTAAPAAEPTNP